MSQRERYMRRSSRERYRTLKRAHAYVEEFGQECQFIQCSIVSNYPAAILVRIYIIGAALKVRLSWNRHINKIYLYLTLALFLLRFFIVCLPNNPFLDYKVAISLYDLLECRALANFCGFIGRIIV